MTEDNTTTIVIRSIDVDADMGSGERLCEEVSDRHRQYIDDNLEQLKEQCDQFKNCLDELYSKENPLLVLEGNDLGLDHICKLVQTGIKESAFDCVVQERITIREDLVVHLENDIRTNTDNKWAELKQCISNRTSESSALDHVCNLTLEHDNSRELCGSRAVHNSVEHFLNDRLESLQCTCNSLPKASSSMPLVIGAAVGGLVMLILVVVIVCLVVWSKKKKASEKTKRTPDPWEASYSASTSDKDVNVSMYSEISDNMPLNRMGKDIANRPERMPPVLPSRYAKDPTCVAAAEYNSPWDHTGKADYLEPLNPAIKEEASVMTYEPPWDKGVDCQAARNCGGDPMGSPPGYHAPDPPRSDAGGEVDVKRVYHDDDGYETLGSRSDRKAAAMIDGCQDKSPSRHPSSPKDDVKEDEARTTIL